MLASAHRLVSTISLGTLQQDCQLDISKRSPFERINQTFLI